MTMLVGHRTSAARVKEQKHDSKEERKAALKRAHESMKVSSNTKERLLTNVKLCFSFACDRVTWL